MNTQDGRQQNFQSLNTLHNHEWITAFIAYIDPFNEQNREKLLFFASNLPSSADMEKQIKGQKLVEMLKGA
jgi:hypothetical protein